MSPTTNRSGRQIANFKDRDAFIRAVIIDRELSPVARLIAVRLAEFLNVGTGRCNPAIGTLAAAVGVTRRSAIRALGSLEARGWITVRRSRGRHTNNFSLTFRTESPLSPVNSDSTVTVEVERCHRRHVNNDASVTSTVTPESPNMTLVRSRDQNLTAEEKYESKSLSPADLDSDHAGTTVASEDATLPAQKEKTGGRFEEFYRAYPVHVGKGAARTAYIKIMKNGAATEDELIAAASRYARERAGKEARFTKHPRTWLNAECWNDEPVTAAMRPGSMMDQIANAFAIADDRQEGSQ